MKDEILKIIKESVDSLALPGSPMGNETEFEVSVPKKRNSVISPRMRRLL